MKHTNDLIRSYAWGMDLSGSMRGAGGMGGLLAVNATSNGVHFPCFDGNGNVTATVDASNSVVSARFVYGPFAETIGAYGPIAPFMPFRFSTKYHDEETSFYYYGQRYLENGRWLSRDPIGKDGGFNLYGFVSNDPISSIDILGLTLFKRANIAPLNIASGQGLLYSCNCGWLDGAHIQDGAYGHGNQVYNEIKSYDSGKSSGLFNWSSTHQNLWKNAATYQLTYKRSSLAGKAKVDTAIAIFMDWAYGNELLQFKQIVPGLNPSAFSVEDLSSYFLGTMIAANVNVPGEGMSEKDLLDNCEVLTPDLSRIVYDEWILSGGGGIGDTQGINTSHRPKYFNCSLCDGADSSKKGKIDTLYGKYGIGNGRGNFTVKSRKTGL